LANIAVFWSDLSVGLQLEVAVPSGIVTELLLLEKSSLKINKK
jgi:hypothetical protein